jgi:recombinational DNA repair protein (RecF pathway)
MQEYLTDAVVLDYEPVRDQDGRFTLYTEKYGKLTPSGVSVRKITSKLIGHLQPGYLTTVRLVEKKGLRLVDAMKRGVLGASVVDLHHLNRLLPEGEHDHDMWRVLAEMTASGAVFSWVPILRALGWDPAHAGCVICGAAPAAFHMRNQDFFCTAHAAAASGRDKHELLYV